MTMKKTDLYKNLGKQIERQNKAANRPDRFGQGAAEVGQREKKETPTSKRVTVTCRLPAELANRLRAEGQQVDGGVSAIIESALQQWLERERETKSA